MNQHLIQDYENPSEKCLFDLELRDDQININEAGIGDERGIMIEFVDGSVKVRIYTLDKESPITVLLPDTGGYEIDNCDIERES